MKNNFRTLPILLVLGLSGLANVNIIERVAATDNPCESEVFAEFKAEFNQLVDKMIKKDPKAGKNEVARIQKIDDCLAKAATKNHLTLDIANQIKQVTPRADKMSLLANLKGLSNSEELNNSTPDMIKAKKALRELLNIFYVRNDAVTKPEDKDHWNEYTDGVEAQIIEKVEAVINTKEINNYYPIIAGNLPSLEEFGRIKNHSKFTELVKESFVDIKGKIKTPSKLFNLVMAKLQHTSLDLSQLTAGDGDDFQNVKIPGSNLVDQLYLQIQKKTQDNATIVSNGHISKSRLLSAYNIKLMHSNMPVQPKSGQPVEITLKVPNDQLSHYRKNRVELFHLHSDPVSVNNLEKINFTFTDKTDATANATVTFTVSKFSEFAFVKKVSSGGAFTPANHDDLGMGAVDHGDRQKPDQDQGQDQSQGKVNVKAPNTGLPEEVVIKQSMDVFIVSLAVVQVIFSALSVAVLHRK